MKGKLTESVVKLVLKHAQNRGELLIGINPDSTLGRDIMKQNVLISELIDEVRRLRRDLSGSFPKEGAIPEETRLWMDEVGMHEVGKILRYTLPRGSMMYSHEYLRDTPLDEIKARFGRNPADPAFTLDGHPID